MVRNANMERNFRSGATGPNSTAPRRRLDPIGQALRNCLPVQEYALAVLLESGDVQVLNSPRLGSLPNGSIFNPRFLELLQSRGHSRSQAHRAQAQQDAPQSPSVMTLSDGERMSNMRRLSSISSGSSLHAQRIRPSKRPQLEMDGDEDGKMPTIVRRNHREALAQRADVMPIAAPRSKMIAIGDTETVKNFYHQRFRDLQQSACKYIAKAFVKLVEPRKQTSFPYTGGNERAPPWWPSTTGPEAVRHREPDHLLKHERLRLLVHILIHVMQPVPLGQEKTVTIKKLEEVTNEAMSNWFADREHPKNALKKPYLKEIFKVAKADERLRNGEVDPNYRVPVMHGDDLPEMDISDDDDDEEDVEEGEFAGGNLTPESQSVTTVSDGPTMSHHGLSHQHMGEGAISPYSFAPGDTSMQGFQPPSQPMRSMEESSPYHGNSQMQLDRQVIFGMGQPGYALQNAQMDFDRRPSWQNASPHQTPISPTTQVFSNWSSPQQTMPSNVNYSGYGPAPPGIPPSTVRYLPPLASTTLPSISQTHMFSPDHMQSFDIIPQMSRTSTMRDEHQLGQNQLVHNQLEQNQLGQNHGFPDYMPNPSYDHGDTDMKTEHLPG